MGRQPHPLPRCLLYNRCPIQGTIRGLSYNHESHMTWGRGENVIPINLQLIHPNSTLRNYTTIRYLVSHGTVLIITMVIFWMTLHMNS